MHALDLVVAVIRWFSVCIVQIMKMIENKIIILDQMN